MKVKGAARSEAAAYKYKELVGSWWLPYSRLNIGKASGLNRWTPLSDLDAPMCPIRGPTFSALSTNSNVCSRSPFCISILDHFLISWVCPCAYHSMWLWPSCKLYLRINIIPLVHPSSRLLLPFCSLKWGQHLPRTPRICRRRHTSIAVAEYGRGSAYYD